MVENFCEGSNELCKHLQQNLKSSWHPVVCRQLGLGAHSLVHLFRADLHQLVDSAALGSLLWT